MAVGLAFQFQSALLLRGNFMFEFGEALTQFGNFIFKTENVVRASFDFVTEIFHRRLAFGDFSHQHIELMPHKLRFKMLQLLRNLFVAPRLACLTLQRTNLALHFFDRVGDAQKILLGVFQLAERFFFLRFEFRDARRFLKNHPAIFRLAGKNLRDVTLRQNAVASAPDPSAHEELLNVLQPALRAVQKVFAAAVAENPARERNLVVGDFYASCLQAFFADAAECKRDLAHTQRLATVCAVENHIGHFTAA